MRFIQREGAAHKCHVGMISGEGIVVVISRSEVARQQRQALV